MTGHSQTTTKESITEAVLRSFDSCDNERLGHVLRSLVTHLHAFAGGTKLTEEEWLAGIEFLTEVGQMCSPSRQEFILLSDALGFSMLVDAINHRAVDGSTESTVLGPFHVDGSPVRQHGEEIIDTTTGQPLVVYGRVVNTAGEPVPGATLDIWQNAGNMLYAVQDPNQDPNNGRGVFRSDQDGRVWFVTIRPVDYPIPHDGPVGRMLNATGRHPWRPAHIHVIGSAGGHRPVTTHIFDAASPYLDSDAVFGVKPSLVHRFQPHQATEAQTPDGMDGPWFSVDLTIVLEPLPPPRTSQPHQRRQD
ncbi:hydroxyquinol 1,2-dioxygenase [Micromonospora rhizosphaerae]|uniref:Hydroxyquinol 1,2-dioxygenase n=1 Tax=Micromonospora rhizosphaerae TaxID=568872 RepID=A0A1C6SC73_9ACTN|nr:intradiol ring-cleavage dioxygenase [Micromonospora rhizosphaerae]SCL27007.1 hydroxyquinol 1,2-dioxygenase [Micromonospora rhizosphaerae]